MVSLSSIYNFCMASLTLPTAVSNWRLLVHHFPGFVTFPRSLVKEIRVKLYLKMSRVLKASTGLTGMAVAKNPHHTLGALYGKILRAVAKMPQDAAYRKYTEQIVQQRAKALEASKDIAAVEKAIGCGQIEEVIVQAENELVLARKMLGWKPWEKLVQPAPARQWDWPPAQISEPKI